MSVLFLLCVVWSAVICAAHNDMSDVTSCVTICQYATPLHKAAQQGDLVIASWLLRYCFDHYPIDQLNSEGKTPLQLASECACVGRAMCNHAQVACLLLDAGADPNPISDPTCDESPLHSAVRKKWPELVELLLEKGANPFAQDINKETPYDFATTDQISHMLLKYSLNNNQRSGQLDLYDYRLRIKQLLKITDTLLCKV